MDCEITEVVEEMVVEELAAHFRDCPLLAAIDELLPVVSDSEVSEVEETSYTSDEY